MRRFEERIVERQLQDLVIRRLRQLLVAVADVRRPEAGHAVEDAVAFAVEDIRSFTLDDHARPRGPQRLMRGEGMEMVLRVEILELLGLKAIGHGKLSSKLRARMGRRKTAER